MVLFRGIFVEDCRLANDAGTMAAGRLLMLGKPPATRANPTMRQHGGVRATCANIRHHCIRQRAAVLSPLLAVLTHAWARKPQAILYRNSLCIKLFYQCRRDRDARRNVGDSTKVLNHAEQRRSDLGWRIWACQAVMVSTGWNAAHGLTP